MRCKDIERMMIDESERPLSREESEILTRHVSRCVSCRKFQKDLAQIRSRLGCVPLPVLPEELAEKIRALCLAEGEKPLRSDSAFVCPSRPAPVPGPIWAALVFLVISTGLELVAFLTGYETGEPLSFKAGLALTLLAQNVVMLFFAPILIPRFRSGRNGFDQNGHEKFVT